jgi:hypothetical protein
MEVPRIDYAPPLPLHRRRKVRQFAMIVAIIAGMIPLAWLAGPLAWRRVQIMYWQRKALRYAPPPDEVVLDASGEFVNQKREMGSHCKCHFEYAVPWSRLDSLLSPPGRWPCATLFLHGRKNPKGEARLIVVEGRVQGERATVVLPTVVQPNSIASKTTAFADAQSSVIVADLPGASSWHTRWFAGQIDLNDDSHFTIPYDLDGVPHVMDGWLMDDDTVKLEQR